MSQLLNILTVGARASVSGEIVVEDFILLETGDIILLETGDKLKLESSA